MQVAIVLYTWVPHAHENVIVATLAPPSTFQCSGRCEAQSPELSLEWTGDQTNIQAFEIQITLQDGHHLVNYNEIHENLQAFVSSDN